MHALLDYAVLGTCKANIDAKQFIATLPCMQAQSSQLLESGHGKQSHNMQPLGFVIVMVWYSAWWCR